MSARTTALTVGELAEALGGRVEGDPTLRLMGIRDLREAGPEHLSFLSNARYRKHLPGTRAGAVLVDDSVRGAPCTLIRVEDPYVAFAHALGLFHPQVWPSGAISPQAYVSPSAQVDPSAHVEAFASVGPGAIVGPRAWLQSGVYVGARAKVGAGSRLMPNSVVMDGCELGEGVWLNPGAVIGSEGFGFAPSPSGLVKIPQVGRAIIEDGVEIGANSCVDRAAMDDTRVGRGAVLDNFVQVGHAAQVGPHNVLVAYSGVAGSTRMGAGVTLAARASVLGHLEIGDGVTAAAHSMVARDTPAGAKVSGVPAMDHGTWLRATRVVERLPELERTIRRLERRLAALESEADRGG